jgi:hypothetical protein
VRTPEGRLSVLLERRPSAAKHILECRGAVEGFVLAALDPPL